MWYNHCPGSLKWKRWKWFQDTLEFSRFPFDILWWQMESDSVDCLCLCTKNKSCNKAVNRIQNNMQFSFPFVLVKQTYSLNIIFTWSQWCLLASFIHICSSSSVLPKKKIFLLNIKVALSLVVTRSFASRRTSDLVKCWTCPWIWANPV